jgi:hypothetical protein
MEIRNNATGKYGEYALVEVDGDGTYTKVGMASTSQAVEGTNSSRLITAATMTSSMVKLVPTAALGTVRGVVGSVTANNSAIASGSIAGTRGLVTISGVNDGGGIYAYGAQGKLVITGTMNHADSRYTAGMSQLDATGATLTAGQLSGHWIDISGISGAGGGQFNAIRITANKDAKPASLIYGQLDASYVFDWVIPTGGATSYVATAGTNSASAGAATGVATKVFIMRHDNTVYYVPMFAGNT